MKSQALTMPAVFAMIVLPSCFLSCSPDPSTPSTSQGKDGNSARQIMSSGAFFRLGSLDPQSSPGERTGWTRFAHDYWLDTTEVTQTEYQNLTGRDPASVATRSASKPVVSVTWFDAILFCNARSKRDHLDTIYEYSSASADLTGSVWALQGLTSHLDRNGWRLPTEAEWEYAARAGSTSSYAWGELADSAKAVEYAWFLKNAGASLHEAAKLKPNAWGFYDMAGNVMEWVQDWKGAFPKDTVTDFVGPDAPPDVPEAPLKGGAYTYGLEHLRPSSRTATYAAYRSAKAEYVGFRCARGGFTPTYTNASGQAVQAPPVSILRSDVARLLGARSARLVFLNRVDGKGILSWIDYGESSPVVRSLPDKDPVFHPAISPDGNWVAWCTVLEGSTGTSRIKARKLSKNDSTVLDLGSGAIPRWWVNGTDTFLIRGSTAMDNTGSDWSSGNTLAQRWSGGGLTGSVDEWTASGGYHDGRSGRHLYTGYRRLKRYDVGDKSSRTLFAYPQNGKSAGDTSQVCNASAAPDGSGRVMFLDFGYSGRSTVVGRPYGIHEVAFVADSVGNVLQTFPVASGKSQWDHLEWSNHPQWAVGVALENSGAYEEVHLLDLSTGNTLPLASGSELWMPNLWVGDERFNPSGLKIDPDSAGNYEAKLDHSLSSITGDAIFSEFSQKVKQFWGMRDSIQIAMVGSSRMGSGIICSEFHTGRTYNWGMTASHTYGDIQIVRNYLLLHSPNLKVVGLSLMPGWLLESDGLDIWKAESNSVGFRYDQNHGFWRDSIVSGFDQSLGDGYPLTSEKMQQLSGDWYMAPAGWGASPPLVFRYSALEESAPALAGNLKLIRELARDLQSKGILLFMINFPQSRHYKEAPYAETYGVKWDRYRNLIDSVNAIEKQYSNFHVYDAYNAGENDYDSLDFNNESHLSELGARKLSHRLDSVISSRMK